MERFQEIQPPQSSSSAAKCFYETSHRPGSAWHPFVQRRWSLQEKGKASKVPLVVSLGQRYKRTHLELSPMSDLLEGRFPNISPIKMIPEITESNKRIRTDLFGHLMTKERSMKFILTITDVFTKYIHLVAILEKEAYVPEFHILALTNQFQQLYLQINHGDLIGCEPNSHFLESE